MAINNHERVGKALDLLKAGLGPFVEREVRGALESRKLDAHRVRDYGEDRVLGSKPIPEWDVAGLLKLMWDTWHEVFRKILGPAERSLVSELRDHRNKWAHQESFSSDDAYRALDSVGRLLAAVSAPQSEELEKRKLELLRVRFDEQTRGERRKQAGTAIESTAAASLKPWREIVTPHRGTVKLSSLAAFSPPAATAKSLILSLRSNRILPQNGQILLNLTVPTRRLFASMLGRIDGLALPSG